MTQKPRNADYTREYNRKAVLRILRRQAMSRAELARATGLTRAAASLIVEELLNAGVVTELAPQSAGRGRSATPLALLEDSYYALAVDLARKGCTVGLCDIGGNLLQCRELPEQSDMTDAIAGALASLLESVDRRKVLGIGISAPGPLDCEKRPHSQSAPVRAVARHGHRQTPVGRAGAARVSGTRRLRHGTASAKHRAEPELYAAVH